jgi:hypothetical protein
MALWKPDAKIGLQERVGRRLFDEPMLQGTRDQKKLNRLKLTHFEEDRGSEYSIDRLGRTGVEKKIARFIRQRAQTHGASFTPAKGFQGWATLPAAALIKPDLGPKYPAWRVVWDPILEPSPNDNEYHAHALKPEGVDDLFAAYQLREHFEANRGVLVDHDGNEINLIILSERPKKPFLTRCQKACLKGLERVKKVFARP